MTSGLDRFTRAQDAGAYAQAIAELSAGAKRSHWIWFIFPQLAGLGSSPMAQAYGLQGADEAVAYLRHPVLRERLLAAMNAVRPHEARLRALMGSEIDTLKLVSSMTLFQAIATREKDEEVAAAAADVLAAAARQGLSECAFTREELDGRA